jgi:hypothetical protein
MKLSELSAMRLGLCAVPVVLLACAPLMAQEKVAGLRAEYWEMLPEELEATAANLEDFPTITDQKPILSRADATVNIESTQEALPGTALVDNFYIRWTGKIRIAKEGNYTFITESDDGSRLFINGKQVVDNGGAHAMQEASGEIELKAGDHEILIEYYEIGGDAGMKASWEGPDLPKAIIPESALSHKKE